MAIEKDIFSELKRYIFQISIKYIKLVTPKIRQDSRQDSSRLRRSQKCQNRWILIFY